MRPTGNKTQEGRVEGLKSHTLGCRSRWDWWGRRANSESRVNQTPGSSQHWTKNSSWT